MSVLAVVLLGVVPVLGGLLVRRVEAGRLPRGRLVVVLRGERDRGPWGAVALVVLLAGAAAAAWVAGPTRGWVGPTAAILAVAAAGLGGGPVVTAVLAAADPGRAVSSVGGAASGVADPEVLRGGAWIGVLERLALAVTLLLGWPEGLPVVLAVKGLGRFAELKETPAAERFIIGTLASVLWACSCAGVAVVLLP